ncbi:MAG: UDP-N-acetylglucosamine 2-epimerase [Candidatus Peregrinibacteria bacterium Gr01-1014_25]|nr:MAG: UDP-N-acetylglucosamine 2-epimerase [Candidatus Peregrinibacteria bacterium Gr01-1014_25]
MKVLSIASARPNFVKLAAVHHALATRGDVEHVIVHTGQHYDPLLSDVFFEQLHIPQPAENLGIHGGTREEVIDRTKKALIPVLKKHRPDWVLVYGDVNGALGGAQAAKEAGCKLAHVEAGLRSGDMDMPEEHNRIGVDTLADLLLCTEQSGVDHLRNEKVKGRIELVGNTMIDTLIRMMPLIRQDPPLNPRETEEGYGIVTLHRPSNVDNQTTLRRNLSFFIEAMKFRSLILPMHHRLKNALDSFQILKPGEMHELMMAGLHLCPPLGYLQFLSYLNHASFILTDSGGIQEEAVLLKKRCFTLRKNTERPVTIDCGSNVLIDIDKPEDRQKVLDYAANPTPIDVAIPPLWDGKAGERIVEILRG